MYYLYWMYNINIANYEKAITSMQFQDYISKYKEIKKFLSDITSQKLKIALLRSYSSELIEPILLTELYQKNIYADYFCGKYNQVYQECADSGSELYQFNPNTIILNLRIEDFYPIIYDDYLSEKDNIQNHIQKIKSYIDGIIKNLNNNLNSNILICDFCKSYFAPQGIFHSHNINGLNNIIRILNLYLAELTKKYPNLFIVNNEELIAHLGYDNIIDDKMWRLYKNPYKPLYYIELGKTISSLIGTIYNKRKKCIIVDLDNTLWSGILSDDGYENLTPNTEIQKQLLYLKQSGILLALNSKNDYKQVMDAFNTIPDMILHFNDFIIKKINFENKDINCIKIADELNIGLDSCIFIDDNEFEIELVKNNCPDISTVLVINNKINFYNLYTELNLDFFSLTTEDYTKTQMYEIQFARDNLKNSELSYEDYLISLNMNSDIYKINASNIHRISQLSQKTNQFNLTYTRYTQQQLEFMKNNSYLIYCMNLTDKLGSTGIIGAVFIDTSIHNKYIIDNFILSCRAMSRTLEYGFMQFIIHKAIENNITEIQGKIQCTEKNKTVHNFYSKCGFVCINDTWTLNLNSKIKLKYYSKVKEK